MSMRHERRASALGAWESNVNAIQLIKVENLINEKTQCIALFVNVRFNNKIVSIYYYVRQTYKLIAYIAEQKL